MMTPPKPTVPPAAQPKFGAHFDAWNSSSTGHQRAENRLSGSTGWRQSRTMKLSHQFRSGGTGGKRISDLVGAGSDDWDEKAKALIPKDVRTRAKVSIGDMLTGKGIHCEGIMTAEEILTAQRTNEDNTREHEKQNQKSGIFDGVVIYINGSTYPLISDHKLKQILSENGAKLTLSLGRKQVTHVILGRPVGLQGLGAGGGLAASKIEKEISKVGGFGLKYVGVEWVLESLRVGKRLPETQFANLKVAAKRQGSVYGMFKAKSVADT